jgi:hypothetical protein
MGLKIVSRYLFNFKTDNNLQNNTQDFQLDFVNVHYYLLKYVLNPNLNPSLKCNNDDKKLITKDLKYDTTFTH